VAGVAETPRIVDRRLTVGGHVVRYRTVGEGEPVVLLHGLSGSGRWFGPVIAPLAEHHRVHLVDLPGFGSMAGSGPRFVLEHAAYWLARWLEALALPAVTLVGHSMGATVCLRLAAAEPGLVRRLVLIAPAGGSPGGSRLRNLPSLARTVRRSSRSFLPLLARDAARAGPLTVWRVAGEVLAHDVRAELRSVRAPALLVWGAEDALVPPLGAAVFLSELPDVRLLVLEGAGHVPMFDRPTALADAVVRFLAGEPVGA